MVKKASETTAEAQKEMVAIPPIDVRRATLTIIGDTSLICHNWTQKAKREILEKQMKKPKQAKEAKDPESDFLGSLYTLPDAPGYWFKSVAIKSAAVDACTQIDGITKVMARGVFHICGNWVKIKGKPTMREDMVRIGMGTADIRYRSEFLDWSITFDVRYNARAASIEQIVNMVNVGGFSVGIGDWRPERNGNNGMFHVATGKE